MPHTDTPKRNQSTVQVCRFAYDLNRKAAAALIESPKVTVSAALLAFSKLDAQTQADLCKEARVIHATPAAPTD